MRIVVDIDKVRKAFDRTTHGVGGATLRAVEIGDASRRIIHQEVVSYGVDLRRVARSKDYAAVGVFKNRVETPTPLLREAALHALERNYRHDLQRCKFLAHRECDFRCFDVEADCHTAQEAAIPLGIEQSDSPRQLLVARTVVGAMTCKTCGYILVVNDRSTKFSCERVQIYKNIV